MMLPEEIVGLGRKEIQILWEDHHQSLYNARELRLRCRCAFCIEEMTGRILLDESKVPIDVVPKKMELLGNYAISIQWSDGHDFSVYRFQDLRNRCGCSDCALSFTKSKDA